MCVCVGVMERRSEDGSLLRYICMLLFRTTFTAFILLNCFKYTEFIDYPLYRCQWVTTLPSTCPGRTVDDLKGVPVDSVGVFDLV